MTHTLHLMITSAVVAWLLAGGSEAFCTTSVFRPRGRLVFNRPPVVTFFISPSDVKVARQTPTLHRLYSSTSDDVASNDDDDVSSNKDSDDEGPPVAFLLGLFGAVTSLVFRSAFAGVQQLKTLSRVMLATFMFGGAAMRLDSDAVTDVLVPMVPPPLPRKLCVYVSGLAEAACGVLLLIPKMQAMGAKLTIALLVGVFPANIYHAFSKKAQEEIKMDVPQGVLYARLAIQVLFMYWATWFAPELLTSK